MAEYIKTLNYTFDRKASCKDIVKRAGVLSPSKVTIRNHPITHPVALFNATCTLIDDKFLVFARMILGYYMYVSAVVKIELSLDDILTRQVSHKHYEGEIILYPSTMYDIWGVEDPRLTVLNDKLIIIYSGRTIRYFDPSSSYGRVLPMVASSPIENEECGWIKHGTLVLSKSIRENVIADKDAFIIRSPNNDLFLFHRPHITYCEHSNPYTRESYHLAISRVKDEVLNTVFQESEVSDTTEVLSPAYFERSLGWGTPPVEVERNKYIALVHATDNITQTYRAFAIAFSFSSYPLSILSLTPEYIFEPKETYEVYGDRPMVVFPCGLAKVDDMLIVTYGAADSVVGFGIIDETELLGLLNL